MIVLSPCIISCSSDLCFSWYSNVWTWTDLELIIIVLVIWLRLFGKRTPWIIFCSLIRKHGISILCFGSSLCLLFHWIAKWQKSNFILFSPFISWIIAIQVILIMGKHPFSNYLLILWYSLHWQGKIKLYFVLFNRKIKMMLIPQHHSKVTKEDFLSFWFFFFFFAFSH